MAKKQRKASVSGYFREKIKEHPELLNSPTGNQELMDLWDTDHPHQSRAVRKKVLQNLANLKSHLRKKERGEEAGSPRSAARKAASMSLNYTDNTLAALEERIDECRSLAKNLEAGEEVIEYLRLARNKVVVKLGQ
jgi:hypothetical protein